MPLHPADEQPRRFDDEGHLFLPDVFRPEETNRLVHEAHETFACGRREVVRGRNGRTAHTAFAAHRDLTSIECLDDDRPARLAAERGAIAAAA